MNMPRSLPSAFTRPPEAGGFESRLRGIAPEAAPTLRAYARAILRHKWFVTGWTLAIVLITIVVLNLMTPIYRATATILVEGTKNKIVSIEDLYGVASASREAFITQAELLKSRE